MEDLKEIDQNEDFFKVMYVLESQSIGLYIRFQKILDFLYQQAVIRTQLLHLPFKHIIHHLQFLIDTCTVAVIIVILFRITVDNYYVFPFPTARRHLLAIW